MFGVLQHIRKSYKSNRRPQMIKQTFDSKEEAEHWIMRYRNRFPYTTADFCVVRLNVVAEYSVELVEKKLEKLCASQLSYFDTDSVDLYGFEESDKDDECE